MLDAFRYPNASARLRCAFGRYFLTKKSTEGVQASDHPATLLLSDDVMHYLSVHIGKSEVAATITKRELLVIQSHQV